MSNDAPQTVDAILEQRGSRYGKFKEHALITQYLKHVLDWVSPHELPERGVSLSHREYLAPDQVEAIEMIFHKIGRILNGDPNYDDSWVDIAGYAKLVSDRLQGKAR